jgi:hypothetical protein
MCSQRKSRLKGRSRLVQRLRTWSFSPCQFRLNHTCTKSVLICVKALCAEIVLFKTRVHAFCEKVFDSSSSSRGRYSLTKSIYRSDESISDNNPVSPDQELLLIFRWLIEIPTVWVLKYYQMT